MQQRVLAALFLGLLIMTGCSKKQAAPKGLFFSGSCRVEVLSKTKGTEIFIDGIGVGQQEASVEIPCGEKQIIVKKHGYRPFYSYYPVEKGRPIRVTVELEKIAAHKDFGLSSELLEQIANAEELHDPALGPRPEKKSEKAPSYLGDLASLTSAFNEDGSGGAAAGGGFIQGTWDSVDDWR